MYTGPPVGVGVMGPQAASNSIAPIRNPIRFNIIPFNAAGLAYVPHQSTFRKKVGESDCVNSVAP